MRKQLVAVICFGLLGMAGGSALNAQNLELPNPPASDEAAADANVPDEAAEDANVPVEAAPIQMAPAPAAAVAAPTRGSSMAQVERVFGPPSERAAAVGQPPITRWVYPAFTVYFEYEHVVHAVTTARQ
jgi:hypothetical protein